MTNGTHDNNSFNNGKFQKFPYTPASDPTQDFHVVNKRFVGSISSRVSSSVEALRTSLDAVSSTGGGAGNPIRIFEDTDAKISTGDSSAKVVFNSAQFSINRTDTESVSINLAPSICITGAFEASTVSATSVSATVHRGTSISVSEILTYFLQGDRVYISTYMSLAGGASINTSNYLRFNVDGSTPLIVSAGQVNTYSPIYGLSTSVILNDYGLTASSISMSVLRGVSISGSTACFSSISLSGNLNTSTANVSTLIQATSITVDYIRGGLSTSLQKVAIETASISVLNVNTLSVSYLWAKTASISAAYINSLSISTGYFRNITVSGNISASSFTATSANITSLGFGVADPGDDRILVWNEQDDSYKWCDIGANLTYTTADCSLAAAAGVGGMSVCISVNEILIHDVLKLSNQTSIQISGPIYMRGDAAETIVRFASTGTQFWQKAGFVSASIIIPQSSFIDFGGGLQYLLNDGAVGGGGGASNDLMLSITDSAGVFSIRTGGLNVSGKSWFNYRGAVGFDSARYSIGLNVNHSMTTSVGAVGLWVNPHITPDGVNANPNYGIAGYVQISNANARGANIGMRFAPYAYLASAGYSASCSLIGAYVQGAVGVGSPASFSASDIVGIYCQSLQYYAADSEATNVYGMVIDVPLITACSIVMSNDIGLLIKNTTDFSAQNRYQLRLDGASTGHGIFFNFSNSQNMARIYSSTVNTLVFKTGASAAGATSTGMLLAMSTSALGFWGKGPALQTTCRPTSGWSTAVTYIGSIAFSSVGGTTASNNARFSAIADFVATMADRLCSIGIFRSA